MKKHKREPKFYEEIITYLPPDMDPLLVIKEQGCENDFFILTDSAKRMVCKYRFCPHMGVCLEAS